MEPAEAERDYRDIRWALYDHFVIRLRDLLPSLLAESSISISQIDGRTKDVKSFAEKIRRKTYHDPFQQMKDIAALRIVTYYDDDVPRVTNLLRREFNVDNEHSTDKAEDLDVGEFGYRSFHLVCSLNSRRSSLKEWEAFRDLAFEVQVRSVLQHAWAAISHKLDYKVASEAPRELRRQLLRLSALLELADDEFASIRDQIRELDKRYRKNVGQGNLSDPLNLDSLRMLVNNKETLGKWNSLGLQAKFYSLPSVMVRADESSLRRLYYLLDTLGVEKLHEAKTMLELYLKDGLDLIRPLAKKAQVHAVPLDVAAFAIALGEKKRLPRTFVFPGSLGKDIEVALLEMLSTTSKYEKNA